MMGLFAEYQNVELKVPEARPFIQPAEVGWPTKKGFVLLEGRVPDEDGYAVMTYIFDDGTGYQRLFGTDVLLGEW